MKLATVAATVVGTALLALSAPIQAEVHRVEIGQVPLDDVPPIPETLAEQTRRYQPSRSASFQGGLADGGIRISTRLGETSQLHHLQRPMAAGEPLSVHAGPVGGLRIAPKGEGFIFGRDRGGKIWPLLARDEGHDFKKTSNPDSYQNAVVRFLPQPLLGDEPQSADDAAAPVQTRESGDSP